MDPLKKRKEKNKQSGASAALLLPTIAAPGTIVFEKTPGEIRYLKNIHTILCLLIRQPDSSISKDIILS